MKKFYASLIGPLMGAYFPLPDTLTDDNERRVALNTSKLKGLWCSIYTAEEVRDQIASFTGLMLPDHFSCHLDYDSFEVQQVSSGQQVLAASFDKKRE